MPIGNNPTSPSSTNSIGGAHTADNFYENQPTHLIICHGNSHNTSALLRPSTSSRPPVPVLPRISQEMSKSMPRLPCRTPPARDGLGARGNGARTRLCHFANHNMLIPNLPAPLPVAWLKKRLGSGTPPSNTPYATTPPYTF